MAEAQNALFTEELVDSKSPYTDLQIGDADNGTTWYWFYDNKTTANSRDYGEFTILQGVSFDGTKKTIEDILSTAKLASFIPNTLIHNIIKQGGLARGEAYKIVKKWSKDDKYDVKDPKKRAKGHGFEFFRLKASDAFLSSLKKKHDALLPEGMGVEGEDTSAISTEDIDV